MIREFDFDELHKRLAVIMQKQPKSQAAWCRLVDMDLTVFTNFINRRRKGLQYKNAVKLENFINQQEKEMGIE